MVLLVCFRGHRSSHEVERLTTQCHEERSAASHSNAFASIARHSFVSVGNPCSPIGVSNAIRPLDRTSRFQLSLLHLLADPTPRSHAQEFVPMGTPQQRARRKLSLDPPRPLVSQSLSCASIWACQSRPYSCTLSQPHEPLGSLLA